MRLFDTSSLPALEKLMNLSAWRQRVYASNVANAGTPGYQRLEANFAGELARTAGGPLGLEATDPEHLGAAAAPAPAIEVRPEGLPGAGDGVDLDREMVALAQNQLTFDLAARVATLRIAGIRAAILGRR